MSDTDTTTPPATASPDPAATAPSAPAEPVNPLVPEPPTANTPDTPEHVDRWDAAFDGVMEEFEQRLLQQSGNAATVPNADGPVSAPVEPTVPTQDGSAPEATVADESVHPTPEGSGSASQQPPVTDGGAVPEPLYPVAEPITIGNLTIPRDQAEQQLAWLNSLSAEQQTAIAQALSGQPIAPAQSAQPIAPFTPSAASGPGVPAPVANAATVAYGSPAGVGAGQFSNLGQDPNTAPIPHLDPASLEVLEAAAPGIGNLLSSLAATSQQQAQQLASYQSSVQQQATQQAALAQSQTQAQIDAAHVSYIAAHPEFASTDIDVIARRGAEMQILPTLLRQHNGDLAAAYHATLDTAMWADPVTRDRAVQAQFAASQAAQHSIETKRGKAAALSGSTGTVPRGNITQPSAMTPQERHTAIAGEIAAAQAAPHSS